MEKVKVNVVGKEGTSLEANLVSKSAEFLVVYFPAAGAKVTMKWVKDHYEGRMGGMDLSSNGKVVR